MRIDSARIEAILEKVQKAPRYTGGEMNTAVKAWDKAELHYGFCFPDTYEVGMSHLGMKILYYLSAHGRGEDPSVFHGKPHSPV